MGRLPRTALQESSNSMQGLPDVVAAAKRLMLSGSGFYSPAEPELFADDFVFSGEILGPATKALYLYNLGYFKLYEAFPDLQPNPTNFMVDPIDPRRVWWMVRVTGTHQNPIPLKIAPGVTYDIPPTGRQIRGGPEIFSAVFDKDMKVKLLTVGYCADKDQGTNGGFGAAFGLLHGIGVDASLLRFVHDNIRSFLAVNRALADIDPTIPCAVARDEDVPKWWNQYKATGVIPA